MSWHAGPLRTAIHALKYKHNPTLAETLAGLMAHSWPVEIPADAALVPVPLAAERVRQRGFNQAEVLARHLSQSRQLPYLPNALSRVRATPSQVGLNAQERHQNMVGAFEAVPQLVQDRAIILIDDVCTTGATLSACAEALLQGGAQLVWAYTLARASFADAEFLNQEVFL
jgi:ComF family protein